MTFLPRDPFLSRLLLSWAVLVSAAAASAAPGDAVEMRHLRVLGGLGGTNQFTQHEERFWTRELPRLSQGRYGASIMPFDQAGVPGQKMLHLVSVGVVPMGMVMLNHIATEWPDLAMPDMAGLNPDIDAARRNVDAFRPAMEAILHERFNARLLAVQIYPAQVVFCKKPLQSLAELKGRRVRVSGYSQADFVRALGGEPVFTEFGAIMTHMGSDRIDCAITSALAGHRMGLHLVTESLFTLPINWGLGLFLVNEDAWAAFPGDLKALLTEQMPQLEARIWAQAARDTQVGVDCNTGAVQCSDTPGPGAMVARNPGAADERLRRQVLAEGVLPGWMRRCGAACARLWNKTLAPAAGVRADEAAGAGE